MRLWVSSLLPQAGRFERFLGAPVDTAAEHHAVAENPEVRKPHLHRGLADSAAAGDPNRNDDRVTGVDEVLRLDAVVHEGLQHLLGRPDETLGPVPHARAGAGDTEPAGVRQLCVIGEQRSHALDISCRVQLVAAADGLDVLLRHRPQYPAVEADPGARSVAFRAMEALEQPVAGISVVLPAYNEETNVGEAVGQALEVLPEIAEDFEVIVVDDGSGDGTAAVVEALVAEHHPNVRLLRHDPNRGYGAAIRSGFQHARFDLVFYTDSDLQFDLSELAYFLPLMDTHDVVIGFRVYRYDTVLRSILSWVYNRLVTVLFRVRVRDVDCAYKMFSREALDKLVIESDDFFVDTELVARARKWNFRIAQKGVRHYPRVSGETTVRASDIPRTLRTIGRMWRRIYFPSREQRREAELSRTTVVAREELPARAGEG
jgi:Glycosyl transferase family 2